MLQHKLEGTNFAPVNYCQQSVWTQCCQTFQFFKRTGCYYAIFHLISTSKTQFPAGLLILTSAVDRSILAADVSIPRNFKSQYPFINNPLSEILGYIFVGALLNEWLRKSRNMPTNGFSFKRPTGDRVVVWGIYLISGVGSEFS